MKKSYFGFSKTVFSLLIKMHMQPNLLQVLSCTGKGMHVWRERGGEGGGGGGGVKVHILKRFTVHFTFE